MPVLEADRLILRYFRVDDAQFVISLLNEPSFIRHIGDKGVRPAEDAKQYLLSGPMESYDRFGYGLYRVELKKSREPVGICGLVRSETLDDPDIGYALLERYWLNGYAGESVEAVLRHAHEAIGLQRSVAIVTPDNYNSIRLLEKIGLTFERMNRLADDDEQLRYFVSDTRRM